MVKEIPGASLESTRWSIDLPWFQQNNRSFLELARRSICSKCREKFTRRKKKVELSDIFSSIHTCCSHESEFITQRTPLLEAVFRLLLASPKQTLTTADIAQQLGRRRRDSAFPLDRLARVLDGDRWYGIVRVDEMK